MPRRTARRSFALLATVLTTVGLASAPTAASAAPRKPAWAKYVLAPSSRTVHPVRVVDTTGSVQQPRATFGAGAATLTRAKPAARPQWPAGTTADASSFHAPNNGNDGQPRTYVAANAIDGDTDTFWNDDTETAYPDVLTVTTSQAQRLDGITLLSSADGVPQDWTVDTWDGRAWQHAATVTGSTDILHAVRFAAAVTTTRVRITVTRDQSLGKGEFTRVVELYPSVVDEPAVPSVTLDFGKVVAGYPRVKFAGASDNRPGVRLAFSETRQYLTDRSDFTRSDNGQAITPGTDQHAVPRGRSTWTDRRECAQDGKVCADGLHGFRYLKISLDALPGDAPLTTAYGTVRVADVALRFTPYLGTPDTFDGWFESSDAALNRYWYAGAYTNELITDRFRSDDIDPRNADAPGLEGKLVLTDGAKRDRDPYVGDVYVSGLTAYLTHSDTAVAARNVLADLADHQRSDGWIPPASINNYTLPLFDYPMYWVTASSDYVRYTGDLTYARRYWSNLTQVLDHWYPSVTDDDGLLHKGLNGTSGYGDYAFLGRTGQVTYYNALYVLALKDAAMQATALGHGADAARWKARAAAVGKAVNAKLWDSGAGAYLDSAEGAVRHGQDGNGYAVTSGLAPKARAKSALAYLNGHTRLPYGNSFMDNDTLVGDGSKRVYAFTSFPEITGRFLSGAAASAIDEIKRLYGWMAGHDPGSTFWEGIGENGSMYEGPYTSAAHGWSTGVVPELSTQLLGAEPVTPGFRTWRITPHPGGVAWARGQLPTPHGPLQVSWHSNAKRFTITVTAPRGTSGTLVLPDGRTTVRLKAGTHTVTSGPAR